MKACLILIVNLQILYVSHVPFTRGREGVKNQVAMSHFSLSYSGQGVEGVKGEQANVSFWAIFFFEGFPQGLYINGATKFWGILTQVPHESLHHFLTNQAQDQFMMILFLFCSNKGSESENVSFLLTIFNADGTSYLIWNQ